MKTLGQFLIERRKALGLSQKEMAALPKKFAEVPAQQQALTDAARRAATALHDFQDFLEKDLLARSDGGYAVEVARAGSRDHLVPVSLGLFDDAEGLVQVTGSGLAAGQEVVVPTT